MRESILNLILFVFGCSGLVCLHQHHEQAKEMHLESIVAPSYKWIHVIDYAPADQHCLEIEIPQKALESDFWLDFGNGRKEKCASNPVICRYTNSGTYTLKAYQNNALVDLRSVVLQ